MNFLCYWKMDEVKTYLRRGETLDYAASKQLTIKKVNHGDTIWIVTSLGLNLELVGRLDVSELVSKVEAEGILNRRNLFGDDASAYAINANQGTTKIGRIDITDSVKLLQFIDSKGRPASGVNVAKVRDPREKRSTFGQAFQSMRRLSQESAALLDARLAG